MQYNVERYIRKIEGRDCAFIEKLGQSAAVQDFIRFPKIIPNEPDHDLSSGWVDRIRKNSTFPSAADVAQGKFKTVWVTGDPVHPQILGEDELSIGVRKAFVSEFVSHSIATDPTGSSFSLIADLSDLPIGLFEIVSDNRVVGLWARKGRVGMYRRPSLNSHAIKRLSEGITTELYAADPAASAIQYAISHMTANVIKLHACDGSFAEYREGSIPIDDRFIYPDDVYGLLVLHAICLIATRNLIDIRWTKGTMLSVPGAESLDIQQEASP